MDPMEMHIALTGRVTILRSVIQASLRPDYITISGWIYPSIPQPGDVTIVGKITALCKCRRITMPGLHLRNLKPFAGIKRNSVGRDPGEGWHKVFSPSSIPLNQWSSCCRNLGRENFENICQWKVEWTQYKSPKWSDLTKWIGGNLQIGRWCRWWSLQNGSKAQLTTSASTTAPCPPPK